MTNDDLPLSARLAGLEVTQHEHDILLASHGEALDTFDRAVQGMDEMRRKLSGVFVTANQNTVDLDEVQGAVFEQGEQLRALTALMRELTEQVQALQERGAA